jgi:hypothetical protein
MRYGVLLPPLWHSLVPPIRSRLSFSTSHSLSLPSELTPSMHRTIPNLPKSPFYTPSNYFYADSVVTRRVTRREGCVSVNSYSLEEVGRLRYQSSPSDNHPSRHPRQSRNVRLEVIHPILIASISYQSFMNGGGPRI